MALPLPTTAKKKSISYTLPKEGAYKIVIKQADDKVDEFENSFNKGNHYYNLRVEHENGRTRFDRIDYLNKEGHKINFGYNFIIALKEIAIKAKEIPEPLREKFETEDISSDDVFNALVKYEVPFYVAYRNTKSKTTGDIYTNINNYFDPFYELDDEVRENLEKRKIEYVPLESDEEGEDVNIQEDLDASNDELTADDEDFDY